MPYADPAAQRDYQRRYWPGFYADHRAEIVAAKDERRRALIAWVRSQLTACVRCGEDDPACLDFHHRDPTEKEIEVTVAAKQRMWGRARLAAEIAKCDVLCANCHRKYHAGRFHSGIVQR